MALALLKDCSTSNCNGSDRHTKDARDIRDVKDIRDGRYQWLSLSLLSLKSLPSLMSLASFVGLPEPYVSYSTSAVCAGFIQGKYNTSLMLWELVNSITMRSIPIPKPPVGGIP